MERNTEVVIIGGGAVGLFSAFYLVQDGFDVTLIDDRSSGRASDGNAGMIVPSHIVPLAAPGVVSQGLRWLFNRESPFYIKPGLDWSLYSWLLRFRSFCSQAHVDRSIPLLLDLSRTSVRLYEELAADSDFESCSYSNTGLVMVYNTEKSRRDSVHEAELARQAGLDVEVLDRTALRELDPGIRSVYNGGVLYRCDGRIDPNNLFIQMDSWLVRKGVRFLRDVRVDGLVRDGEFIRHLETSQGPITADSFVLAAGAWSARLARKLGSGMPVQPAKGYSITIPTDRVEVRFPHILTDERLTVTPMPGKIRFAGTLALSGFDDKIDTRRTLPLKRLVKTYFPELSEREMPRTWYGYRPCSPDGLPFIGRFLSAQNVLAATGHGMMGITLAPVTGKLIADQISERKPILDPGPFTPDRFN